MHGETGKGSIQFHHCMINHDSKISYCFVRLQCVAFLHFQQNLTCQYHQMVIFFLNHQEAMLILLCINFNLFLYRTFDGYYTNYYICGLWFSVPLCYHIIFSFFFIVFTCLCRTLTMDLLTTIPICIVHSDCYLLLLSSIFLYLMNIGLYICLHIVYICYFCVTLQGSCSSLVIGEAVSGTYTNG